MRSRRFLSNASFACAFASIVLITYMSSLTTTRLAASQFALLTSIFALSGSLVSGVSGYFSLTGLRALFHRDVPYRLQWRSFADGSGGGRERPRKRQTAAKSSPIETPAAIAERTAAWRLYASSSHKRCEELTTRRRVLACLGNSGFAQAFERVALGCRLHRLQAPFRRLTKDVGGA